MKKVFLITSLFFISLTSCQGGFSEKDKKQYISKGKEIAKATADHLGGTVKKKMQEGGVAKAVPFCQENADDFTKEMADKYKVAIKRTSQKLRNENNLPDSLELIQLKRFQKLINSGEQLKPVVEKDQEGKIHFYGPIKVQKKCLACHGVVGETMEQKSDSIIKSLYPKDKATGFKEGDLRGMWSISFTE
jgi:hypothetical protein